MTLRLRYAREMAHLEVHDTGPGMTAEELSRIFEPFTRGSSASTGTTGAGLGLTIAKMLTDLMGGELTASSVVGQGSVFKVRLFLPALHLPAQDKVQTSLTQEFKKPHGYAGGRRHILVVDNEEADRELLFNLLQLLGFVVRTAASGHDALDLLASGYMPDAILLDLAMPGIDGWETLRRIRALGIANTPAAIVSANAFDRGLENDVGIKPEDFIVKPVRHSELLGWLERQLELVWQHTAPPAMQQATHNKPLSFVLPPKEEILALEELLRLGYFRGIMNALEAIASQHPACQAFTEHMSSLARQYQFETMLKQLHTLPHEPPRP